MSAVATCVQPGSCVCCGAGSMPAMSRSQSADETRSHRGEANGMAGCDGQLPLPRRGGLLTLCPELIPESCEVLSLTIKPNNLLPSAQN